MNKNKQRVLVIDDAPLNIQMVGEILSSFTTILPATNGKRGIELAHAENKPDLILLDIMMPEVDGFTVCTTLKNDEATKDIPIIFMTGSDSMEDEAKGLELGAVDYVTKPFHPPVLKARVKNQLNLKQKTELLEKLVSIDG